MNRKKKLLLTAVFVFLSLVFFSRALAVNDFSLAFPLPNACPVPGACPSNQDTTQSIAAYITRIYQLAVGLAGILAVGMIVFGSIYISVSGDSPDKREEGRSYIMSAIWGLLLLLGSYVILRTVNPQLVSLHEPTIPQAPQNPYSFNVVPGTTTTCPTATDNICFYDPYKNTNIANVVSPATVGNVAGTVIDKTTTECSKWTTNQYPCVAEDAQIVARGDVPIKSSACNDAFQNDSSAGGSPLGVCFLEQRTRTALLQFITALQNSGNFNGLLTPAAEPTGWRITEAFPPTSHHSSSCHYNGTCFDFSINILNVGAADYSNFCNQLKTAYTAAQGLFQYVVVEAPDPNALPAALTFCQANGFTSGFQIQNFENTTGFHIHIAAPKPI